jgi:spore germination protein YaaH
MKKFLIFLLIAAALPAFAQQVKSVHQEAFEEDLELGKSFVPSFHKESIVPLQTTASDFKLTHAVFGFLRYSDYTGSYMSYIRYDLLTHIAPFGFSVSSSNGAITYPAGWPWTSVINNAHNNGVKVIPCVANFDAAQIHSIITGTTVKTNFFANIKTLIQTYSLDGVNIDFEGLSTSDRGSVISSFMAELTNYVHTNCPGAEVSFAGPAINWSGWDFTALAASLDYIFIMGYDFYGTGSATTGPSAPLLGGSYNVTTIVTSATRGYDAVVKNNPEKLILGFPYYGNRWSAKSATEHDSVISHINSPRFNVAEAEAETYGKLWAADHQTPWYAYNESGVWKQVWYDDSVSLGAKYDLVKSKNLKGTGMWALGYDADRPELWETLKRKFTAVDTAGQNDTIIADFEVSAGVFGTKPSYSGSTKGIDVTSTSARVTDAAYKSTGSLQVTLKDDAAQTVDWAVRLLSGTGSAANNKALPVDGKLKLYLKTSSAPAGAQIAVTMDDIAGGTELSAKLDVVNDGSWHLYEWSMQDSTGWTSFASGNGLLNGPTATLDAIMLYAPNASADWTFNIDDVRYCKAIFIDTTTTPDTTIIDTTIIDTTITDTTITDTTITDTTITDTTDIGAKPWEEEMPTEFAIAQNYPNPFNPSTIIRFDLPNAAQVTLKVYDMLGRETATLIDEYMGAGRRSVKFDGRGLSSGIYIYVIKAGTFQQARKMILAK